jgi:hypothetical protein
MKKECEARLRGLVPNDEPIVAVGTAEQLRTLGPDIGSGGGFTFIVVTSQRLLFATWDSPHRPHEEISLGDVVRCASGTQYNSEALVLTHPPKPRTETIFRFSRPDTQVARALHSALSARNIVHEALRFEEKSRAERTRGSRAVLYSKEE